MILRHHDRIWSDPLRTYRTLLSFAETEEDGGKDLVRAARRVTDPELQRHLERHSSDELRHATLFRQRAAELAAEHEIPAASGAEPDSRFDLLGARPGLEVDAHGFYSAGLIDELGELAYVAMLQVAEQKAAALFAACRDSTAHDAKSRAVFEEILRDEAYHVSYTASFLERWRKQGRGEEVARSLKDARRGRLLDSWRRLGARSASAFAHAILFVAYWTLLAPIGLVARAQKTPVGWQEPRSASPAANGRGQY